MTGASHRAGVVALLGRPNAGKSTLLNRLLGQKIAIVSRKPQTTRSRILGILNRENAQLLLYDTPGFHTGTKPLNRALNEVVDQVVEDCDVAVLVVDPCAPWDAEQDALLQLLRDRGCPIFLAATKSDWAAARSAAPWPSDFAEGAECIRVSARTGKGVEELLRRVEAALPESPAYFDGEELTDRSLRFLAAEHVREAAFDSLSQELPYVVAVEVTEFDESRADLVRIRAHLLVERASQKAIVIGAGGSMVRRIGIRARQQIEELVGCQVHLDLQVKLEPHWSKRPKRLKSLGYS